MAISSLEAAYELCSLSNWTLTNLKLQKLLYVCHLYYLGEKDEPLIEEAFEAWTYGPVVRSLYFQLKVFRDRPIQNVFYEIPSECDKEEIEFITNKYPELASKSAWDLVVMTHLKGGAWEQFFDENGKYKKIPNAYIKQEYMDFYQE